MGEGCLCRPVPDEVDKSLTKKHNLFVVHSKLARPARRRGGDVCCHNKVSDGEVVRVDRILCIVTRYHNRVDIPQLLQTTLVAVGTALSPSAYCRQTQRTKENVFVERKKADLFVDLELDSRISNVFYVSRPPFHYLRGSCILARTGPPGAACWGRRGGAQRRRRARFSGRAVRRVLGGAREYQVGDAGGHRAHGRGSPQPCELASMHACAPRSRVV